RRKSVDALVEERVPPGARMHQPRDRVHQRRLARAVRAEHADDLPLVDAELGAPQHLEVAVSDVEPLDRQHRAGHCVYARPRYASTTRRSRVTTSGGPSAITSPSWSATMRCATAVITRMLCSITSTVRPPACRSRTSRTSSGIVR